MPSQPNPSFETLFDENMAKLWRLGLRLCGNREDAEDLLQEAALIGFRAFERFEPNSNFGAWMGTIMVNAQRNRIRSDSRRVSTVSLDTIGDDSEVGENILYERLRAQGQTGRRDDPSAQFLASLDGALIAEAFHSLPPEFRECCALFWVGEFSYDQIAQALNVPVGTVRSRLHRGRKLLQRALWTLARERGIVRDDPPEKKPGTSRADSNLFKWVVLRSVSFATYALR